MSADAGGREYTVGDRIRMKLEFEHTMNLTEAAAGFVHESDPQREVLLFGDVYEQDSDQSGDNMRTLVCLDEVISTRHRPGEYELVFINAISASGRRYRFSEEMLPDPRPRFRVVEERSDRILLRRVKLLD